MPGITITCAGAVTNPRTTGQAFICIPFTPFRRIARVGRARISVFACVPAARAVLQRPQLGLTARRCALAVRPAVVAYAVPGLAVLMGITHDPIARVSLAVSVHAATWTRLPALRVQALAILTLAHRRVGHRHVSLASSRGRFVAYQTGSPTDPLIAGVINSACVTIRTGSSLRAPDRRAQSLVEQAGHLDTAAFRGVTLVVHRAGLGTVYLNTLAVDAVVLGRAINPHAVPVHALAVMADLV